jgi:hypothetical protein
MSHTLPTVTTAAEGLPSTAERIATMRRILDKMPKPPKRRPFFLTDEKFAELTEMREADRGVHLGILAHAHEYEQRRLIYRFGGALPMPAHEQARLVREWPEIRADREAEAHRVFDAMAMGEAA